MHVTKNTTVNAAPTKISSVSDYSNYRLISNKRRITRLIRAKFSFSIRTTIFLASREEKLRFIFRFNAKKKKNKTKHIKFKISSNSNLK